MAQLRIRNLNSIINRFEKEISYAIDGYKIN